MGALQSCSPDHREYIHLKERTGFSYEQIGILHNRFKLLSHDEDTLQREDFNTLQVPDLEFNPIRNQIIEAFFDRRNFRLDMTESEMGSEFKVDEIGFEEFLVVMSHFRPPKMKMSDEERQSVRKEKFRFLYNMHDTDNDGTITLEEYRHVVEELLSSSGALGKETAKGITDSAMLEVAGISMGKMEPDEFYEGITFEHFCKLLHGCDIESRMSIHFLKMDRTTICK